ncbi:MAG TPA: HEAT repeat domain-containing protein [Polyangiaceae bacterium]|nr:HEAT repeat domain-containing protein [Polyangiaceae bacterium]
MLGRSATAVRFGLRALLITALLLSAPLAPAEGRVQFLAERLRFPPAAGQADDFRVRTNAALALGATNDDDAVQPLCAALNDPSEVVRQAAGVSLKRLLRAASLECLRRRAAVETNTSVKQQLQRAIEAVDAAAGGGASSSGGSMGPAPYVADAKYYVSISPVANGTTRPSADVDRAVREAIASKLGQVGGYQLAPAGESNQAAREVIARRKLKGYYLAVSVDKLDYSDGSLRVRVKIAVFSYPGKDLRGEVPAGATLPGARPGDKGAEDQLIGLVATRAAELFAQNFR